jgi:small subunit ribosomal protein S2
MKRYIFDKRNGIHIIDLSKSLVMLKKALEFTRDIVVNGRSVLFVGTKKQAQEIIKECATTSGQHYVTHRWLGGTLTNNATIRRSIERMRELENREKTDNFGSMPKQEASALRRELEKLRRNLSGIANMRELPGALFVVDITREAIAVTEANKLGIPVIAIVDTNCDPDPIQYLIPGNDDSLRAIKLVVSAMAGAVKTAAEEYAKIAAEIAKKREAEKAAAEAKRAAEKAARDAAAETAEKEAAPKAKPGRKTAEGKKTASRKAAAEKAVKEAPATPPEAAAPAAPVAAEAAEKEDEAKAAKKPATPIVPDRKISALAGTRAAELIVDEDSPPVDAEEHSKKELRRPPRKRQEKGADDAE